ncbi:hypothetical protein DVJ77_17565 [Dyella tabacisoli]|uniref:Uncharacterized protein n=1 Tax=Dyella tabacisoli TaxID=2282381 RepID=A0A369UI59_9GAMM|nr:hypothetical protein DVJ77_17565 [Dyella tabacisoli]
MSVVLHTAFKSPLLFIMGLLATTLSLESDTQAVPSFGFAEPTLFMCEFQVIHGTEIMKRDMLARHMSSVLGVVVTLQRMSLASSHFIDF